MLHGDVSALFSSVGGVGESGAGWPVAQRLHSNMASIWGGHGRGEETLTLEAPRSTTRALEGTGFRVDLLLGGGGVVGLRKRNFGLGISVFLRR